MKPAKTSSHHLFAYFLLPSLPHPIHKLMDIFSSNVNVNWSIGLLACCWLNLYENYTIFLMLGLSQRLPIDYKYLVDFFCLFVCARVPPNHSLRHLSYSLPHIFSLWCLRNGPVYVCARARKSSSMAVCVFVSLPKHN